MSRDLTEKQKRFVAEYLIDQNGAQAAIRAGYAPGSAKVTAARLLTRDNVKFLLAGSLAKQATKLELTADVVLHGIHELATYDPRAYFNEDGSAKEIGELSDKEAKAVAGFEFVTLYEGSGDQKHAFGQLRKIKLADRGVNLERLGRHLKLFTDNINLSGGVNVNLYALTDCQLEEKRKELEEKRKAEDVSNGVAKA